MAVRQLTSNKKQYRSSIIIVAILAFFLVMITVLNTGLDEQTIEKSFGVNYSDIGIAYNPDKKQSREELTELQKQVEIDMSKVSPIEKAFRIDNDYFMVNGDEYHGSIYEDTELIKSILKGRVPCYDNEIAITEIVAKELGVKIGNKVTVGNADMEDEYIITGYFQSTYDLGRTIAMSQEGAKRILPDYHMDYVDYVIADSSKSAEIVKILEKEYGEQIEAKDEHTQDDVGDTIMNSMSILNM
jgi:ABC-type lipoprotein release transport system permease subunit